MVWVSIKCDGMTMNDNIHRSEMEIATKMHSTVKIMTIFSLTRDFNLSPSHFFSVSLLLFTSFASLFCLFGREKVSNEWDDTNNEKHDYINSVHKLLQLFVFLSLSLSSFLSFSCDSHYLERSNETSWEERKHGNWISVCNAQAHRHRHRHTHVIEY